MSPVTTTTFDASHRAQRPGGVLLDVALGCVALAAVLFLLVAAPVPRDAAVTPASATVADAGPSAEDQIDMRARTPSDSIAEPRPR